MDGNGQDYAITTTEALERVYTDAPYGPAVVKEADHVTPEYRKLIEAAPFVVLATCGPEGHAAIRRVLSGSSTSIPC
jgi:predicted pyridoxine 5'-phosphate oxidase superfamily flavin-nucleotide-binding protein